MAHFNIYLALLWCLLHAVFSTEKSYDDHKPPWMINVPPDWFDRPHDKSRLQNIEQTDMHQDGKTTMLLYMASLIDDRLARVKGFTDGEMVDMAEHFFWGKSGGLAIELGALDGTWRTHSQTEDLEDFGWMRILIDGNPKYRKSMPKLAPKSYCVLGAICMTDDDDKHKIVHYQSKGYVGGILEFMSDRFLKDYHTEVYKAGTPYGNLTSVNWDSPDMQRLAITPVHCIRLSAILTHARAQHINFFILDVEGGEFEVLQSISWERTTFDVLCIETEKVNRPVGYEAKITDFLALRGYTLYASVGRNTWYTRKGFVRSSRPGTKADCFNGARKSALADSNYRNRRNDPFVLCKDLK